MASLQSSYTLTSQQLDAALAALAKATDTFRLSPLEERLHRSLGIFARIASAGFIVLLAAVPFLEKPVVGCLGCAGLLVGIGAGVAAILLLALNFRMVVKTVRQRRLLKELGLQDVSYSAWRAHRKRRLWARIGAAVMTVTAVIVLVVAMITGLSTRNVGLSSILAVLFVLPTGATILIWQSLQRSRERLALVADADRLRATLKALGTGPDTSVIVPAAVLEKVAVIEHAQIARERAHAVLAGVSATNQGYGVVISRQVAEKKASLPPDRRLEVEELIEELAAEPPSPSTRGDDGDRVLSAHTPDGSAKVYYRVDERNRRIHVVAVRAPGHESGELAQESHVH